MIKVISTVLVLLCNVSAFSQTKVGWHSDYNYRGLSTKQGGNVQFTNTTKYSEIWLTRDHARLNELDVEGYIPIGIFQLGGKYYALFQSEDTYEIFARLKLKNFLGISVGYYHDFKLGDGGVGIIGINQPIYKQGNSTVKAGGTFYMVIANDLYVKNDEIKPYAFDVFVEYEHRFLKDISAYVKGIFTEGLDDENIEFFSDDGESRRLELTAGLNLGF